MDATQIILIVFIVLLIIIYPILISSRNKKENQRMQEQTNSLKRGDRVLTTSGVYGTIVDLHLEEDKKIVTIETGTDKKKGYISVDAYAIYTVFKDEEPVKDDKANEEKLSADKKIAEEKTDKKEVENVSLTEPAVAAAEQKPAEEISQEKTEKKTSKKSKKKE